MSTGELLEKARIALVHDELTRRGGAEVVLEELIRIFPQADVFALYAGRPVITVDGLRKEVHTSFLQRWPRWFRRHPSRLLPLLPQAAESFDLSEYDLVISSASGFAKSVITRANVPHICYCHTPTRYLWEEGGAVRERAPFFLRWPLAITQHRLRLADFAGAQRVDTWLANSEYTRRRIATYYRQPSQIVYPPIDTHFFRPAPTNRTGLNKFTSVAVRNTAPFLAVGRLTPSKYFDTAIAVCEKLRLPLIIIGRGREYSRLQKLAGSFTRFIDRVSQEELRDHYRGARALLQPGVEDFGMAAAEALACGTPVIARGEGGILELARHGETGILYSGTGSEGLAEGIRQFLQMEAAFDPQRLWMAALPYSREAFAAGILAAAENALASRQAPGYTFGEELSPL